FNPGNGGDNARMKATLHSDYDYKDPEDAASTAEVHATSVLNFPTTNNQWVRMSVPFDYSGAQSSNAYVLVTFTTNETAGGGTDSDELFIDDMELIYNPSAGVVETESNDFIVSLNNENNTIDIQSDIVLDGEYFVYSTTGQSIQSGVLASTVEFNQKPGVYFVKIVANNKTYSYKVLKN
ncbi:MAG: T9SS type A sorting domain-containing protein, partial [Methylococcales bacterium]|nr:T9SS type A sorting domain-containing protein [Methylococcales bacterium]